VGKLIETAEYMLKLITTYS